MNYKFKTNDNGRVNALFRTGQDIVKNEITIEAAEKIVSDKGLLDSDRKDYPIHAGNWYFEGEIIENNKPIKKAALSSAYGKTGREK